MTFRLEDYATREAQWLAALAHLASCRAAAFARAHGKES